MISLQTTLMMTMLATAPATAAQTAAGGLTSSTEAGGLELATAPRTQRRSGRIVAGGVLMGVGAPVLTVGALSLVLSPMASFGGGEQLLSMESSAALTVAGAAMVGVGIPLFASGFKRVPVRSADVRTTPIDAGFVAGPGSVEFDLRF